MLYEKLKEYSASGAYPMHMPGHKRTESGLPFDIDITEIDGFDDLHNPQGLLLDTAKLAAKLYGSQQTFLLINGSTVGILAAIGAHTKRGDRILADATCHRSIPNAAELFGLQLSYITPTYDKKSGIAHSITSDCVRNSLRQTALDCSEPQKTAQTNEKPIKLVVITSPSYEGIVSDIASIAEVVHDAGTLLLVDCAHGAHFGFSSGFPKNPVSLGADVVVTSLHKTFPALTQCSLLHVCSNRADTAAVKRMLSILQTSSPSYVLMASIDHCLRLLDSSSEYLFRDYEDNLVYFSNRASYLKNLSLLRKQSGFYDFDPGKIVIASNKTPISGFELSDILRTKYKIEVERANDNYAIAMTSICDSRDGFMRLADALTNVDKTVGS